MPIHSMCCLAYPFRLASTRTIQIDVYVSMDYDKDSEVQHEHKGVIQTNALSVLCCVVLCCVVLHTRSELHQDLQYTIDAYVSIDYNLDSDIKALHCGALQCGAVRCSVLQ